MPGKKIAMIGYFHFCLSIFNHFSHPRNSYITFFTIFLKIQTKLYVRIPLYLFNFCTPCICCNPKSLIKIN